MLNWEVADDLLFLCVTQEGEQVTKIRSEGVHTWCSEVRCTSEGTVLVISSMGGPKKNKVTVFVAANILPSAWKPGVKSLELFV